MVGASSLRRRARRAQGRCPRCEQWFGCEAWFDVEAPLPTCPRCGALPTALAYETAGGWRTVPETEADER
jgi:ribosomal protein S27AE